MYKAQNEKTERDKERRMNCKVPIKGPSSPRNNRGSERLEKNNVKFFQQATGAERSRKTQPSGQAVRSTETGGDSVSNIFERCEYVGVLGHGLTGNVEEYSLDGNAVGVKIAHRYNKNNLKQPREAVRHVKNELEAYTKLLELQGKHIPRMIAGGADDWFTANGYLLITEKVGRKVMDGVGEKNGLFVDGEKLCESDVAEIGRRAVEGLDAIVTRMWRDTR